MTERNTIIRQAEPADVEWIDCLLRERWHATSMALHGAIIVHSDRGARLRVAAAPDSVLETS